MKAHYTRTAGTVILILLTFPLAYSQFTLTGEIRPRFEYRHGYQSLADSAQDHAAFVDQRTRLNFGYKTEGYMAKIVVQDIRTWGSQPQLVIGKNATVAEYTSIHEAWGEAFISDKFSFKFGRQEIILDDHRIFGSVGWAQQARSHDAGIFKYSDSSLVAQLGFAYNQDASGSIGTAAYKGSYKALQYIWLHKDFNKNLGASVLFLNNGKQVISRTDTLGNILATKDNYSQTFGTRISYKKEKIAAHLVYYGQAGVEGNAVNSEISASLIGFDFAYKLSDKFTATVGLEMQSGNSETDTSTSYGEVNHAFNPFYGTNHKFNGFMDYFYVGNHAGSVGLQDIFFKLKYKPEKYFIGVDVHLFSAAADVRDDVEFAKSGNYKAMNSSLGTEIDITTGFKISKGVMLKAGYSHMLGTETLATLKNVKKLYNGEGRADETSNWGWLMLIVKPQFIKPEKS